MLNLPKSSDLILAHLKAALTAVVRWWVFMSDVERRQTRQRALAIGACAAVFAVGGPLIGHRFEVQKSEEAYRADAVVLAQSLDTGRQPTAKAVSFTNSADRGALLKQVSFALDQQPSAGLAGVPLRQRDSLAIASLANFTADRLGLATREQSELDCLAEAVYYEARSEDTIGQKAVAEVVMNRVHDSRFPKTVCAVVFQGRYRETGCQFTFTCDGSLAHAPYGEAWDRARAVALNVSLGFSKPVTNKATHYHTDYVNPYWKAGLVETAEIGTHIFYRFPKTGAEWAQARIKLDAQDAQAAALLAVGAEAPAQPDTADTLAAAALVKISAEPATVPAVIPASAAPDTRGGAAAAAAL